MMERYLNGFRMRTCENVSYKPGARIARIARTARNCAVLSLPVVGKMFYDLFKPTDFKLASLTGHQNYGFLRTREKWDLFLKSMRIYFRVT